MARAIDKRIMLDLIIEAKKTDPETGPFSEWLAEYLVDHLPTLTPPNEWVSVENALPEECADILLCRKILKIPEIGTYQQARFWVYDEIGDVYQVDDVTHWLPIRTPYDIEHIHISEPPEG